MNSIKPISQSERLDHIDIIRGLAIFGILLVNMAHFSYPDLYLYLIGPDNFFQTGWNKADQLTRTLLDIFVQMKFITMFSFLFGFGMMIMMERATARGQKFIPLYVRRLFWLFVFGTIHAFFIWDGDILMDYALLGLILILFRNSKPKTLFIWAISLYMLFLIPIILVQSTAFIENEDLMAWEDDLKQESEKEAKQALEIYGGGTFSDIVNQRIHDRLFYMSMNGSLSFNPILYFFTNIPYFSMFLLGMYTAKRKLLHDITKHRRLFKTICYIALFIGLPFNILYGLFHHEVYLLIGAPLLMLGYMTLIIILLDKPIGRRILNPLKAVGRTAFTNYIMQSLIATTLFYNYGLGLYGKVYPFMGLWISLAIFIIQLVISHWWLKRFSFGPLEWLWRILTYKKMFSIR